MRINDLKKFSIPPRVIEAWRERQGETLLPVQRTALRQGLLGSMTADPPGKDCNRNMIISAPTSSGKSFCAEMAAIRALTDRRKAVMLFPLKSLAEEKYRLLRATYAPMGIDCLIATGDHPENDRKFMRGDFQLGVAIYEKFDQLLSSALDLLGNLGLVVVDELQMLGEPGRGALLERLLTKIVASAYEPSLLGLSAVLDESTADRLAAWLSARVIRENSRPVDLMRGVAAEDTLQFRWFNTAEDGEEPFAMTDSDEGLVDSLIGCLKKDSGSTLVFLKSRQDTVRMAFKLAASVRWPEAGRALARLKDEEPSCLIRSLTQALTRGVAFHNSDLTPRQRTIVEQAFIKGEVKALCSTTTLALGVNLPADTVYLETVRYVSGNYDSRPVLMPISRAEFDNMTGRAGRYGISTSRTGRAIVLAASKFDRDVLWGTYIAPDQPEPLRSAFDSMAPEDWLLNMVTAGLVTNNDSARLVLEKSLKAYEENDFAPDPSPALTLLADRRLITKDQTGAVSPTSIGKAVAITGLRISEVAHFQRLLENGYPESGFGWTALALSSPFWSLPPAVLTAYEQADNLPLKMLYQRFDHSLSEAACLVPESRRREPLCYRTAASLKALLLLDEWSRMVPVQKLEEQYQIHLGQIVSLGETASHLVTSLATLLEATDRQTSAIDLLRNHAFSLRCGLPLELQSLYLRLGQCLSRSDFIAIRTAGISSLEQLSELTQKEISQLVCGTIKPLKIKEIATLHKEEVEMASNHVFDGLVSTGEPNSIEIDGAFEGERFLVRINGFPVRLTGKSFKYFTKLAWSRISGDTGWIYKEDIELGFNQARYLYRMKNEITAVLRSGWPIIENNRLGYYRLQVEPDRIRINRERLQNHPDWEIRSLFAGASTSSAIN